MENFAFVGEVNGSGDLLHIRCRPAGFQRAVTRDVGQAAASDVVHRDKVLAFAEAHLVDGYDVWVLQAGGRRGLRAETLHQRGTPPAAPRATARRTKVRCVDSLHKGFRDSFHRWIFPLGWNTPRAL